ncbi:MAG: flagellar biosynthesis anti-sigma factor FlgM [Syntrophomonadaceae bacterium]|jgi:negative regulator of flagellin synthesis FlgM
MKIDGNTPPHPGYIYKSHQNQNNSVEQKKLENRICGDKIEISDTALNIKQLVKKVGQLPDIRADLVESIKRQIEEKTYQVPAEEVAAKILESFKKE